MSFDTTPTPRLILGMQNQKWTVAGAIAELVDNSFGPGRGDADYVEVSYDSKRRIVSVLDNGRGMDSIGRLFQLGNTIGHTPGDIGHYGSGGTMAVLWLPSLVEIWTLRDGRISSDHLRWREHFDAPYFPMVSDAWETATPVNTPHELYDLGSGTLIRLHLLRGRNLQPSNVKRDLAQLYAPAVRHGKRLYWTTIKSDKRSTGPLADPMPHPHDPERFDMVLVVRAQNGEEEALPVRGEIGAVPGLPLSQSVVHVGYGHRVIDKTRDFFAASDETRRYSGLGVTGWLDLGEGWQAYLSTTKDSISDRDVWAALSDRIFERIEPMLERMETRELRLELRDIQLQLEAALNAPSSATVEVPSSSPAVVEDGDEPGGGGGGDGGGGSRRRAPGDGPVGPVAATTHIKVGPISDSDIGGLLCKVEKQHSTLTVFVNKDHPYMVEALKQRPANRKALTLTITREIGHTIERGGFASIMFDRRTCERILNQDEETRGALVQRLLIDRVVGMENA